MPGIAYKTFRLVELRSGCVLIMEFVSEQFSDNKQSWRGKDSRYHETLLYGQHSYAPLSKFAQEEARRVREEKRKKTQLKKVISEASKESKFYQHCQAVNRRWISFSQTEYGRKINDLLFLTFLGISVASISFATDIVIFKCYRAQSSLLHSLRFVPALQSITWLTFFVVFTCFATGLTHIISPTAIGSGIPEVKTMLRGVVMKEYLTLRTLVAKIVGLVAALGSGLPVGKEGSFVHIGIIVAALISRILPSFSSYLENHESRLGDILLPGSAVGLSCTFAAPVGALLYSLESTSVNFAVKNYWRSFYASAVGSLMYRLVATLFSEGEKMNALRETYLPQDKSFDLLEFAAFLVLGIMAGLLGACFIIIHKNVVEIIRNNKFINKFFSFNRFIYPCLVALLVGMFMFPPWLGQFSSGMLSNLEALNELLSNFTWSGSNHSHLNIEQQQILARWQSPAQSVFLSTFLFCIMRLWMCALSTTVPFPCGLIFPAFAIGSGLGRLFGETMNIMFPGGIRGHSVIPGGYALVGSVAFTGAVTHTFSPVVIAVELTGQMGYILPALVAVMVANAVSRKLTPSVYDVIIEIKKLPFLPIKIFQRDNSITAEDIMERKLKFLTRGSTYGEAAELLIQNNFKSFPIVDSEKNMMLLGSIERSVLKQVVGDQLSLQNKIEFYAKKLEKLQREDEVDQNGNLTLTDLEWRSYELMQPIDFQNCPYDSAPFQIPCETPLHKVHNFFSLLNLHHAFVTKTGKVKGIISLSEVRQTIQAEIESRNEAKKNIKSCMGCCRKSTDE